MGNLLGDFAKGVDLQRLPDAVVAGLKNHRAVDRFTDAHPLMQEMKSLFSPHRRRFAGIALDVYCDHLLMQFWSQFETRLLADVIDAFYTRMDSAQTLMPNDKMRSVTARMVRYDWFGSYRELDAVGAALDNIARRIRYPNQFGGAMEDIIAHREQLEQGFLEFFPQLIAHVRVLKLEAYPNSEPG